MKDRFFYQDKGKTLGPVTEQDLRDRIREGRIRLFDLIHKEGDSSWRMAMEYPDLKDAFQGVQGTLRERPWVCLQRKDRESVEFKTTGPFSHDEIRESLLAGRMSYNDYAWRTGFVEWKRLGSLEEFNPRVRQSHVEVMEPVVSASPLINVVELRRRRRPEPELRPPEAEGEDLASNLLIPPVPPPPAKEKNQTNPSKDDQLKTKEQISRGQPRHQERRQSKRRRKTVPWFDWGIVFALVLALGVVTFVLLRSIRSGPRAQIAAKVESTIAPEISVAPLGSTVNAPVAEAPAQEAPAEIEASVTPSRPFKLKEEDRDEPPSKPSPRVSRKPTELKISVLSAGGKPRFEVKSNGSVDIPFYVQIIGLPGQVSEGASFYRYMRMKPSASGRPLDFSTVKLPLGKFILRVATGDLADEKRFSSGLNDPAYKTNLARARKQNAHAIWSERLQLFKLNQLLEKRALEAGGGKKFNAKGLESVAKVKRSNGQNYALFEEWYELKEILDEAREQVTPAVLFRLKKAKERLASLSIWK